MKRVDASVGDAIPVVLSPEAYASSQCGICLAVPIEDPFSIPSCDHSFCFECLKSWQQHATRTSDMTGSRREATCPLCRAEFGDVESATVERAMLFNLRASKKDLSAEERAEFVTLALTELDKVLSSNERHIPALFLKATVLVEAGRPAEAVDIVARVLVFDEEGQADEAARMAVIDGTEYSTAVSEGRDGDADRLLEQAEAMAVLPPSSRIGGSGPGRLFKEATGD